MLHRFRTSWLAGGGALLLVLSMSGLASAAPLVTDTPTFLDVNGNGIADTCETTPATADSVAAAAAFTAADLDGNGTISVSEAAQSGWTGGKNCNHGGYVSSVAKTSTDSCDQTDQTDTADNSGDNTTESADESQGDQSEGTTEDAGDQTTDTSTTTVSTTTVSTTPTTCTPTTTDPSTDTSVPAVCPVVVPVAPTGGTAPVVNTAPNAHGTAVSTVAQSTDVGGKNCNHGGAVSAAAHAAHGLDKAAKRAAHLAKHQGKGHGGQH